MWCCFCFFFFKQKTAYEMRISDWSSDVCSSDLKNQNPLEPQDNGEFVAQLAQFSSLEGITTLNETVSGIAGNYNSSQALQASSLEIGRASCRERVCQYV